LGSHDIVAARIEPAQATACAATTVNEAESVPAYLKVMDPIVREVLKGARELHMSMEADSWEEEEGDDPVLLGHPMPQDLRDGPGLLTTLPMAAPLATTQQPTTQQPTTPQPTTQQPTAQQPTEPPPAPGIVQTAFEAELLQTQELTSPQLPVLTSPPQQLPELTRSGLKRTEASSQCERPPSLPRERSPPTRPVQQHDPLSPTGGQPPPPPSSHGEPLECTPLQTPPPELMCPEPLPPPGPPQPELLQPEPPEPPQPEPLAVLTPSQRQPLPAGGQPDQTQAVHANFGLGSCGWVSLGAGGLGRVQEETNSQHICFAGWARRGDAGGRVSGSRGAVWAAACAYLAAGSSADDCRSSDRHFCAPRHGISCAAGP